MHSYRRSFVLAVLLDTFRTVVAGAGLFPGDGRCAPADPGGRWVIMGALENQDIGGTVSNTWSARVADVWSAHREHTQ
jgi:hypothetical protein